MFRNGRFYSLLEMNHFIQVLWQDHKRNKPLFFKPSKFRGLVTRISCQTKLKPLKSATETFTITHNS